MTDPVRPPKVPQSDAAELPGNPHPAVATATEETDGGGWRGRSRQGGGGIKERRAGGGVEWSVYLQNNGS